MALSRPHGPPPQMTMSTSSRGDDDDNNNDKSPVVDVDEDTEECTENPRAPSLNPATKAIVQPIDSSSPGDRRRRLRIDRFMVVDVVRFDRFVSFLDQFSDSALEACPSVRFLAFVNLFHFEIGYCFHLSRFYNNYNVYDYFFVSSLF